MAQPSQLTTAIEQLLTASRARLDAASDGASCSAVHKRGSPSGSLKYFEAQEYVLRRCLALSDRGAPPAKVTAFLDETESKMIGILESRVTRSADWQSYAKGGLAAVRSVRGVLVSETRACPEPP